MDTNHNQQLDERNEQDDPMDALPTDLIDTIAAAKLLHTHANTIRRWIFTGKLRAWRVTRIYWVSRAEVMELFRPVTTRPNGVPCEKQKPGRKSTAAQRKRKEWVDEQARKLGLI